jgi:DNA polymerase (family 10)
LTLIAAELREDQGEINTARARKLPDLVAIDDICGDLHLHTSATDGRADLRAMVQAAQAKGYSYIATTDHSQRVAMAHGLDPKRLARQIDEIDLINAT